MHCMKLSNQSYVLLSDLMMVYRRHNCANKYADDECDIHHYHSIYRHGNQ